MTAPPTTPRAASRPLRDDREGESQPRMAIVRADRADARWIVRAVLAVDTATGIIASVRAIVFDRDTGASVLHTVWTDWRAVPFLAAQLPTEPLASAALEEAGQHLVDALLTLLGGDVTAGLRALGAGDGPARRPGMGRSERQYRQIVRDIAWQDPRAPGGAHPAALPVRPGMSESEAARRQLTERLSGEADRARGDS